MAGAERGSPFGNRYALINSVLVTTAAMVGVDLWTLDGLWWGIERPAHADPGEEETAQGTEAAIVASGSLVPEGLVEPRQRFGLERHLHKFLRDNWQNMPF